MDLWSRSRKFRFYSAGIAAELLPDALFRQRLNRLLDGLDDEEIAALMPRVNYYNRLATPFDPGEESARVGDFRDTRRGTYYLDARRVVRHFPVEARFAWRFGDITRVAERPAIVKSRPISDDPAGNANNVLLKLNRVRHFQFVRDRLTTADKHPGLVWRGHCHHDNRREILRRFHDHPRMDVGQTDRHRSERVDYRPPLSIDEQLRYRFVLSLEGKDVATNLKWILSSSSICMMPPPRFETWFMEGALQPWVHYVPLAPGGADLEEKMDLCLARPELGEEIVRNANAWVEQFRDARRERLLELLVMTRYLALADQLELPARLAPFMPECVGSAAGAQKARAQRHEDRSHKPIHRPRKPRQAAQSGR
ncbi:glycosyl transferase family 90 [Kushneria aurantia]|uniref:Glycosyl transferase family 90 n=1 Tax=Kushneria aurantia TaxID=504092 RepID=A0ABV6G264_9GAMM|nr:glycosyl transferase family 90 [Kushneria aurantia]